MNTQAVTEAIELALVATSLLRSLGMTVAEINSLINMEEDQTKEELILKLQKRQSQIESRINN